MISTWLKDFVAPLNGKKLGYPGSILRGLHVPTDRTKAENFDLTKTPEPGYEPLVPFAELGLEEGEISTLLMNNVGHPFEKLNCFRMDSKPIEAKLIKILGRYFGLAEDEVFGYVSSGGTEGNIISMWWAKRRLLRNKATALRELDSQIAALSEDIAALEIEINSLIEEKRYESFAQTHSRVSVFREKRAALTTQRADISQAVIIAAETAHYSIGKAADLFGIRLISVKAQANGAICLTDFEQKIQAHAHRPLIVIATAGTTVHGAIDDVRGMKHALDKHMKPDNFTIHLDGAYLGILLPILKAFEGVRDYFRELGVGTITISGHKFLGVPVICGAVLTYRDYLIQDDSDAIAYLWGMKDVVLSGSRSGFNPIVFDKVARRYDLHTDAALLKNIVATNLANADYFEQALKKLFPGQKDAIQRTYFNLMFPRPSDFLMKRYQLMPTSQNQAAACVMINVDKPLIDEFVDAYRLERLWQQGFRSDARLADALVHLTAPADSQDILSYIVQRFALTDTFQPLTCLKTLVEHAAKSGLSLHVRARETGNILGCVLIVEGFALSHPNFLAELDCDSDALGRFFFLEEEISRNAVSSGADSKHPFHHGQIQVIFSTIYFAGGIVSQVLLEKMIHLLVKRNVDKVSIPEPCRFFMNAVVRAQGVEALFSHHGSVVCLHDLKNMLKHPNRMLRMEPMATEFVSNCE